MSRGDAVYAKIHVDILSGERVGQLTPNERDTYLFGYWLTAVKYRQSRLSESIGGPLGAKAVAIRLTKKRRTVQEHRAALLKLGLLTAHPDNTITINGVEACHPKLGWKTYDPDFPIRGNSASRYGDDMGHSKRVREYESRKKEEASLPSPSPEFYKQALRVPPSLPEEPVKNIEGKKPEPDPPYNPYAEPDRSDSDDQFPWESDPDAGSDPPIIVPDGISMAPTPEPERWRKVDAIIASIWQHPITDEFRDKAKWKIYNAVQLYPEAVINAALISTRDKQQRILEGVSEPFSDGPGTYFVGTCKRMEEERNGIESR